MRHLSKSRRFGRATAHRKSMFANLATSLFVHERILTTLPRAKELRRVAEKLITLGKRGDLAARRMAASRLKSEGQRLGKRLVQIETALKKLFDTIAPRFKDRPGGYTRIIRTGPRLGDNAPMAFLELLPAEQKAVEGGKKGPAKKPTKAGSAKAPAKKQARAATPKKAAPKKSAETKVRAKKPAKGKTKEGAED